MSLVTHILNNTAQLVEVSMNFYGDQIPETTTSFPCWFRWVTEIDKNNNQENLDAVDALLRCEKDVNIEEGSIILVDGKYFRVDKLFKARRSLKTPVVDHYKVQLKVHLLALAS